MRKPGITLLIFISVIIIVAVIIADYLSTRPGKRGSNPYAYDISEYSSVMPELVRWRESGQIPLDAIPPHAITFTAGQLYLAAGNELHILDGNWSRVFRKPLPSAPTGISVTEDGKIIIAFRDKLALLDKNGEIIAESGRLDPNTSITSVAAFRGRIFAADAAGRKVLVFNNNLEKAGEFKGESGVSDLHGFIVPSGHFSLAVNSENEMWISNPGLHSLQNYTENGNLRSYIQTSSFGIEGFSGCCNPEHFTFLPGGEFVTSEKGIIRIKVIKESGVVESVVAPPEKFEGGTRAPAIAADDKGNVIALDFDRNMIRIFEPM